MTGWVKWKEGRRKRESVLGQSVGLQLLHGMSFAWQIAGIKAQKENCGSARF